MEEKYVCDEPRLVQDTTQAELDYIAARAMEAQLAEEAGSAGGVEDKAAMAAEEEELARWAAAAEEASSAGTEAPLVEDVVSASRRRRRPRPQARCRLWGEGESCGGPVPASRSGPAGLRGHS